MENDSKLSIGRFASQERLRISMLADSSCHRSRQARFVSLAKSLIKKIKQSSGEAAMLHGLVVMTHYLDIKLVAEEIETNNEWIGSKLMLPRSLRLGSDA